MCGGSRNGTPSVHPLQRGELRALRELQRQFPDSGYVFTSERGGPFATDTMNYLQTYPEGRQFGAASLVTVALSKAFPCNK
jgi:hypothetical protein